MTKEKNGQLTVTLTKQNHAYIKDRRGTPENVNRGVFQNMALWVTCVFWYMHLFSKFPSMIVTGRSLEEAIWRMSKGFRDWREMDTHTLQSASSWNRERGWFHVAARGWLTLNPFSLPSSARDHRARDYAFQPPWEPSIATWLSFYQGKWRSKFSPSWP